uniref:VOC family protein n=1 Tax=Bacteroides rodentium TaxID=691816 RepID=UPI00046FFDE1
MKIDHFAMYVNDLEAVKDFFVRYFNAVSNEMYHNKKTDFKSYFLSFEDGSRLEIMTRPGLVDEQKNPLRC